MDTEEESDSEEAEVELEEESNSGVASMALASAYVAKSIFNTEDNGHITDVEADDKDDSAPTYYFMARGAKGMAPKATKWLWTVDALTT